MENFIFQNTTKIIFGKGTHSKAGEEVKKYSKKILLHYGGGSIKKYGLYDEIVSSLKKENIRIFELGGVRPNPILGLVKEGAKICRENNIDFVLAAGGGSVIDSAKAIALSAAYGGESMWDFVTGKIKPEKALPVGVVLTLPAAGSEASNVTVITNEDGMVKKGFHSELIRPKFAILNPEVTFTLPLYQIACGAADIMSHVMERYFTRTKNVDLTDRLCEATLKTVIENAPLAIKNPDDYNPRAELMWAGTIAHNDILSTGRIGDWGSHKIAHELSALYDVAHGASLSVIFPAWMKYVYKKDIDIFFKFSVRVFDMDACFGTKEYITLKGIKKLENFFASLGLPTKLSDLNISDDRFCEMAEKTMVFGSIGNFLKLKKDDVIKIYNLAK